MIRTSGVVLFCGLACAAALILSEPADRRVGTNTILLGVGATSIALPWGLMLAQICTTRGWISRAIRISCLGLIFVPLFMHVSIWDSALGKLGWWVTAEQLEQPTLTPWLLAIWIHGVAAAPQVAVILWIGLGANSRIYEEQAALDTNTTAVFWLVTLPRLLPLVAVSAVWILVSCAREIAVTDIYRIGTFAEQIYLGFSLGELNGWGGESPMTTVAGSLPSLTFLSSLAAIVFLITKHRAAAWVSSDDLTSKPKRQQPISTAMACAAIASIVVLLVIPIVNLLTRASKTVVLVDDTITSVYSVSHLFHTIVQIPADFCVEAQWSALISIVASFVIVSLAIVVMWRSQESVYWRWLFAFTIATCLCLPGPLIGSALLQLRGSLDTPVTNWILDRTIAAPVLANLVFCWPLGCLLVGFILRNTAADTLEHAQLEGASSSVRLLRLAIAGNPLACCGTLILMFAISFGELSASQLVVPPGMDTVPRRMLGMLHSGVNDQTAGLTIVTAILIFCLGLVGWTFVHLNQRNNSQ